MSPSRRDRILVISGLAGLIVAAGLLSIDGLSDIAVHPRGAEAAEFRVELLGAQLYCRALDKEEVRHMREPRPRRDERSDGRFDFGRSARRWTVSIVSAVVMLFLALGWILSRLFKA